MWNWFNCYLSGRHDYGMSCERGAMFLRCTHCGRRSPGWSVHADHSAAASNVHTAPPASKVHTATTVTAVARPAQVLPFERHAATAR
jgi:hypothetical protein